MSKVDFSKLRAFYTVAKEGNLTKASEKLHITQPALSRAIKIFEERLGRQLFRRGNFTSLTLTSDGKKVYKYSRRVMQDTYQFERYLMENEEELRGELSIITTPFLGSEWLIPRIKKFSALYPELFVKVKVKSSIKNLLKGDVIIANIKPYIEGYEYKFLYNLRMKLFASKEYLARYGEPIHLEDLTSHRLLAFEGDLFIDQNPIKSIFNTLKNIPAKTIIRSKSFHTIYHCAHKEIGIAELPDFPQITSSGLQKILPQLESPDIPTYYLYSDHRRNSKKIRLLYEFLHHSQNQ
jgi:DNA-binding transcriptional LysR family regulator